MGGLGAGAAVVGEPGQRAQDRTGWGGDDPDSALYAESADVAEVLGYMATHS